VDSVDHPDNEEQSTNEDMLPPPPPFEPDADLITSLERGANPDIERRD